MRRSGAAGARNNKEAGDGRKEELEMSKSKKKADQRELREAENQMYEEVWDHLQEHFARAWCGDDEDHGPVYKCLGSVVSELAKDYHETQLMDIESMVDEAYTMLEEISRNIDRARRFGPAPDQISSRRFSGSPAIGLAARREKFQRDPQPF